MAVAGSLWVEGSYLHFIDKDGREWRYLGDSHGFHSSAIPGSIWIDTSDNKLRYVDASKYVRSVSGDQYNYISNAIPGSLWLENYTVGWITPGRYKMLMHEDSHGDEEYYNDSYTHEDWTSAWHSDSYLDGHGDWGTSESHYDGSDVSHYDGSQTTSRGSQQYYDHVDGMAHYDSEYYEGHTDSHTDYDDHGDYDDTSMHTDTDHSDYHWDDDNAHADHDDWWGHEDYYFHDDFHVNTEHGDWGSPHIDWGIGHEDWYEDSRDWISEIRVDQHQDNTVPVHHDTPHSDYDDHGDESWHYDQPELV